VDRDEHANPDDLAPRFISAGACLLLIASTLGVAQAQGAASAQPGAKAPQVMKQGGTIRPIRTGILTSAMLKAPSHNDAPHTRTRCGRTRAKTSGRR
jgi:hypothetical protein